MECPSVDPAIGALLRGQSPISSSDSQQPPVDLAIGQRPIDITTRSAPRFDSETAASASSFYARPVACCRGNLGFTSLRLGDRGVGCEPWEANGRREATVSHMFQKSRFWWWLIWARLGTKTSSPWAVNTPSQLKPTTGDV